MRLFRTNVPKQIKGTDLRRLRRFLGARGDTCPQWLDRTLRHRRESITKATANTAVQLEHESRHNPGALDDS